MSARFVYVVFMLFIYLSASAAAAIAMIGQGASFRKAGKPFWHTFVPFLNSWTLHEITWGHGAYMFLEWIPGAGIVFSILTYVKLGQAFRKSGGFIAGLIFLPPVFEMILGFDDSVYDGPVVW